ncbi:MAG: sugar phosphate isomerase/epimerase [Lachnospiraceae bacterium]|nr:sugar phosphate isomerase/epimerase [Lachnospiraceae bacterium]
MKFGCFGFVNQLDDIVACGFDTAELDLCEIAAMDEKSFSKFYEKAMGSGLTFEVFSGLLPLSVRIHGQDFDREKWLSHIDLASRRAALLGARMIPFGAGKCRSIPEGCADVLAARRRTAEFISSICGIFQKYGLDLVIEPLGPANSNFLNRVGETAVFAASLGKENCHTMCDLRHMHKTKDDFGTICENREEIRHAHIDYPRGDLRRFPQENDGYDYGPYFEALLRSGYDGILTIEAASFENFRAEADKSLRFLKKCEYEALLRL